MDLVLVGGGRAAVIMLDYFSSNLDHHIVGVSDINDDAPGMVHAREMKIPTATDMKVLIQNENVDLVLELTGNNKVRELITSVLRNNQTMVSSEGAKLMVDLISSQAQKNAECAQRISHTFNEIRTSLSATVEKIDDSSATIEHLLREANIVSVNATIEAARAGQAGKPFETVVHRLSEMVRKIKEAADVIGEASQKTKDNLGEFANLETSILDSFTSAKR